MNKPAKNTILLIDDSIEHQILLTEIFAREGVEVISASNGKEGLEALKTLRPTFILLDLMMPVMDGFEFRAIQMKDEKIADIPVVVLTADGQVEKKLLQLQVSGYLRKPVDISRLLKTAQKFFI
jgi:CheY-like chemotaxis protein